MNDHGKRLGRLVKCPVCRKEIDPIIVTEYPENRVAQVPIPARTVVMCPAKDCPTNTVWYIVKDDSADID